MSPASGEQPPDESATAVVVTARFWASARAAVGVSSADVRVPTSSASGALTEPGAVTVADVIDALTAEHGPRVGQVLSVCSVLYDGLRVDPTAAVQSGAELEFLPPFAGG